MWDQVAGGMVSSGNDDLRREPRGKTHQRPEETVAWIKVVPENEASAELKAAYDHAAGARGSVANILRIHSVNPKAMLAHLQLYRELMFGESELTRAESEMLAVAVSSANECHY